MNYRQSVRRLVFGNVPRELAEGVRYVRGDLVIGGVLAVTMAMNLLGFPYSALVAPIGRGVFQVSPAWVGVLAASEGFGAFLGGALLTSAGAGDQRAHPDGRGVDAVPGLRGGDAAGAAGSGSRACC